MSSSQLPKPSRRLTLQLQLRVYEAFARSDDAESTAAQFGISEEMVKLIVERIPRIAIPLTTSRKLRACLELEELAHLAVTRIREELKSKPASIRTCLSILNTTGNHFARLLEADTPLVKEEHHAHYEINADDILPKLNAIRNRLTERPHAGNGSGG